MSLAVSVTIITPTYNRANCLPQLYESLCKQTDYDFQWLVIDDGSTDDTSRWFGKIMRSDNKFTIDYKKIINGGKHRALNYAHPFIRGDFVMIVDSDDTLSYNAIEIVKRKWREYDKEKDITLLIFQRGDFAEHKQFDVKFLGEDRITTLAELTNHGFKGDHCEVTLRSEFLKFRFPEFENEKFIGEAWLWQQIGWEGKSVFINEVIYLCEYLEGGLTQSGRSMRLKNPQGGREHAKIFLNPKYNIKIRLKNAMLYVCYERILKKSISEIITSSGKPCLICIALLPGTLLMKYWMLKYGG